MGDSSNDARIKTSLPNHPKMLKLEKRLGSEGAWAFIKLLLWVTDVHPSGELTGVTDEFIELAVRWTGKDGEFISTLREVGFIDGEPGAYVVHKWDEHNHFVATRPQRQLASRIANDARWNRFRSKADPDHVRAASDSDQNRNPRSASLRSASQRSASQRSGKGKDSASSDDFNAIEAARYVQIELNIAGERNLNDLAQVIESNAGKAQCPPRVTAECMVAAWNRYNVADREFRVGVMKFFCEGIWCDESRWQKRGPSTANGAHNGQPPPTSRRQTLTEKNLRDLLNDPQTDPAKLGKIESDLRRELTRAGVSKVEIEEIVMQLNQEREHAIAKRQRPN